MDHRYVDVFDLARQGRQIEGEVALGRFERLLEGLPPQEGEVGRGVVPWVVRGQAGPDGRPMLAVRAQAALTLICQRCLQPFVLTVQVDNAVRLVRTEDECDNDDPDAPDCVVGGQRFDVYGLLEDELILAVPYVPRHEACPPGDQPRNDDGDAPVPQRPSPFAVLADWEKGQGS